MTATSPALSAPPRPATRHVSTYSGLAKLINAEGLLARRRGWYLRRIAALVTAFGLTWLGVVLLGNSWLQLGLAVVLGLVCTQFGFLGHDAAHRQIFASHAGNEWTARLLSGAFAGLSYGWWTSKHNRHHAAPNQESKDPDIGPGALAFTPDLVARRTGWAARFSRCQGWLFFPLLTLEGVNLHVQSVRTVLDPRSTIRHRGVEAALVCARLVACPAALFLLLPPGKAAAFLGVQLGVFGLVLGASFAPNHKGMPIVPAGLRVDFLRRQVLMSRNVRGGRLTDFAMGGLNYQIEHHLFPSMPRPNLRRAQPIVRAYCAQHGVPYTETGLLQSYGIVIRYLNDVGLLARDPFRCPLAAR